MRYHLFQNLMWLLCSSSKRFSKNQTTSVKCPNWRFVFPLSVYYQRDTKSIPQNWLLFIVFSIWTTLMVVCIEFYINNNFYLNLFWHTTQVLGSCICLYHFAKTFGRRQTVCFEYIKWGTICS